MKWLAIFSVLTVAGCSAYSWEDSVILIRNGTMEISGVSRYGGYCWVSWYHGIEHVILKSDGTAEDPPFHYKWEPLALSQRNDIAGLFKRNDCHDPK